MYKERQAVAPELIAGTDTDEILRGPQSYLT
jgi:hypothetical protein